jgi:hypothetical protein
MANSMKEEGSSVREKRKAAVLYKDASWRRMSQTIPPNLVVEADEFNMQNDNGRFSRQGSLRFDFEKAPGFATMGLIL